MDKKSASLLAAEIKYLWKKEAFVLLLVFIVISITALMGLDKNDKSGLFNILTVLSNKYIFVLFYFASLLTSFYSFNCRNKRGRTMLYIRLSNDEIRDYLIAYSVLKSAVYSVLAFFTVLFYALLEGISRTLHAGDYLTLFFGILLLFSFNLVLCFAVILSEMMGKCGIAVKITVVLLVFLNAYVLLFPDPVLNILSLELVMQYGIGNICRQIAVKLVETFSLFIIIKWGVNREVCFKPV